MKLWFLVALGLALLIFIRAKGMSRTRRRSPRQPTIVPRQRSLPKMKEGEIRVSCPGCGQNNWLARARVDPKTVALYCAQCGYCISFTGNMERVDRPMAGPKEV